MFFLAQFSIFLFQTEDVNSNWSLALFIGAVQEEKRNLMNKAKQNKLRWCTCIFWCFPICITGHTIISLLPISQNISVIHILYSLSIRTNNNRSIVNWFNCTRSTRCSFHPFNFQAQSSIFTNSFVLYLKKTPLQKYKFGEKVIFGNFYWKNWNLFQMHNKHAAATTR